MNLSEIKVGLRVRVTHLGSTKGMIVHPAHLGARRVGACGVITGWVPGHGGDVWWISQGDGQVGAYCFDEFEQAE
jgi:hypothetical protein